MALPRGDRGFGQKPSRTASLGSHMEAIMREAEARELPYPFKLRPTKNVARMIEKLDATRDRVYAGHGFQAKESAVRLVGWSRQRRVIVPRRRLKGAVGLSYDDGGGAPRLSFAEIDQGGEAYEYSVLVTSLEEETAAFGQLYRDRSPREKSTPAGDEPLNRGF